METYKNPYGWPLPVTDMMLSETTIPPLPTAEESIAERLAMAAHLSFSTQVWSSRLPRYWAAFGDRLLSSTNTPTVSQWWETLMVTLPGVPLKNLDLLGEKNLLIRPAQLPNTAVEDEAVLEVLRSNSLELRDRTRKWVADRKALYKASQDLLAADAQEKMYEDTDGEIFS